METAMFVMARLVTAEHCQNYWVAHERPPSYSRKGVAPTGDNALPAHLSGYLLLCFCLLLQFI